MHYIFYFQKRKTRLLSYSSDESIDSKPLPSERSIRLIKAQRFYLNDHSNVSLEIGLSIKFIKSTDDIEFEIRGNFYFNDTILLLSDGDLSDLFYEQNSKSSEEIHTICNSDPVIRQNLGAYRTAVLQYVRDLRINAIEIIGEIRDLRYKCRNNNLKIDHVFTSTRCYSP